MTHNTKQKWHNLTIIRLIRFTKKDITYYTYFEYEPLFRDAFFAVLLISLMTALFAWAITGEGRVTDKGPLELGRLFFAWKYR